MVSKLTSFRTSDGMRDDLAAAAKANGISVNQEINRRLEASFAAPDVSQQAFANQGLYGLVRLMAVAMQISGQQAMIFKNNAVEGAERWFCDPYAFDQACRAAQTVLEGCRPDGTRTAPANSSDPAMNDLQTRIGTTFAENVLSEVALSAPGGRGEVLSKELDASMVRLIQKRRGGLK